MAPTIADPQNLRSTPSEMAPSSQAFFVFHPGHQTILDSRNPFWRSQLQLAWDESQNPVEAREARQKGGLLVMAALAGES